MPTSLADRGGKITTPLGPEGCCQPQAVVSASMGEKRLPEVIQVANEAYVANH